MISEEELEEYAKTRNLNLGQAEQDYFQNLILYLLYQEHGKELVFKGGTALAKCYGFDRHSEDLDFTAKQEINEERIIREGLKRFNLDFEIKKGLKILIKGPLYRGIRQSLCSISTEISTREKVQQDPKKLTIRTYMPSPPSFEIMVMQMQEVYAEKIRALLTREQARDLYDIYMMRESTPSKEMVNKKLSYYSKEFSIEEVKEAVAELKPIWKKELKPLVKNLPDFSKVKRRVEQNLERI